MKTLKNKKMEYKIGQTVTFKTKVFGQETIKTNVIKFIEEINGEIICFVAGVGQSLGISLKGKEDCFQIKAQNII